MYSHGFLWSKVWKCYTASLLPQYNTCVYVIKLRKIHSQYMFLELPSDEVDCRAAGEWAINCETLAKSSKHIIKSYNLILYSYIAR